LPPFHDNKSFMDFLFRNSKVGGPESL
jgi:hypothetical protein